MLRSISVLSFLLLAVSNSPVFGQKGGNTSWTKYRHEGAVGYGLNTLYTGLGQNDNLTVTSVFQRSTFNLSYRYYFRRKFAVRGSFTQAYARKNDKVNIDSAQINLPIDYKSSMSEFAAMGEFHILDEVGNVKRKGKVRRARGGMTKGMNAGVSVFGGVALGRFNPYGEYYGSRMVFRPVNSSPGYDFDVDSYKRMHILFPVGATARLVLSENWRLGIEAGYRIGLRDYIDYVSAVYYRDGKPESTYSEYPDTDFADGYVTFEKENAPIATLASESGRRNYFFGMIVLSYRLKTK